jgi:ABC-type glycerol-3-phosphate transport system substrate-binding protein
MRYQVIGLTILAAFIAACVIIPSPVETPLHLATLKPVQNTPSLSLTRETSPVTPILPETETLRIWLPPQFDPASDTPAGKMLQSHLEEYRQRRGVNLEVRIKTVSGLGGLMDSLSTTSAAAPSALPDLIALPRDLLETATLKGLLHSYNGLTTILDAADWYVYSQELARVQDSIFGLPFAGDALIQAYDQNTISTPPADWAMTLTSGWPLLFPASDPQSLFTIAMYQADHGVLVNEQGRPFLDSKPLSEVLTFYSSARGLGVMPENLTQFQSYQQVWDEFLAHRANLVIVWSSSYLSNQLMESSIAPIPTPDGGSFTLASGWVWALAARQEEHYELAVELAEFLTEEQFLANWTGEIGYLPVRSSSLVGWSDASLQTILNQISTSAHLIPSSVFLSGIDTSLQQAVVQILKGQNDPVTAAQSAASSLTEP